MAVSNKAIKNMNDVPPEVIVHIMEYISFEDRKRARLVNWDWYYASIHPIFIANELFTIQGPMMNMYTASAVKCLDTIGDVVSNSKRELLSLKFCGFIDIQVCMFIFQRVGYKITRLFLEDINLMTDAFRTIITQCCNLKTLKLKNIDHWWCLSTESLKPTSSLETLVLKQQQLPDNIFNFIVSLIPNIVTLDLDFNVYNTEVVNARSLNSVNENSILEFLKTSNRLTRLKLNGNVRIFNRLPKNIQLKALHLNYETLNNNELQKFLPLIEEHKLLQKLEVSYLPCCLLKGISKLSNLRELKVKYITNHIFVSDNSNKIECLNDFFASLKNMKDLRKLTIKPDVKIHQKHYKNLPLIPQQILQSLQLLDCYINIEKNNLPVENNLTKLRIRNGDVLKADDFKKISENLIHLKDLRIDQCYHLTDDILLQSKISNIKGLNTLKLDGGYLTYRCLPSIQFLNLKSLCILRPPMRPYTAVYMPDIDNVFKILGRSNPSLTHLCLHCIGPEFRHLQDKTIFSYFKFLQFSEIY